MVDLDKAFSRLDGELGENVPMKGRGIFDRQPARVGFAVAMGVQVLGRPGSEPDIEDRAAKSASVSQKIQGLVSRLDAMNAHELLDYLRCDVLAEVLDRRVGQVGRYEHGIFFEAFKVLLEEHFLLPNLEPCWRAG